MFDNRISIITIVLNQKDSIAETLESVLDQKNVSLEYIIIDGGSTDGTLEIIESYRDKIHSFITGPDGGIYKAINKGIAIASAPIIGLIHCGDKLKPDALLEVCKTFYESNADVVYGDIEIVEFIGQQYISKKYSANHIQLKKKMSIFHPSTFVSKNIYDNNGGYNTCYQSAADYDFFLNLFIRGYKFVHVPKVLAVFAAGGFSEKNYKLAKCENYNIRFNRLGYSAAVLYWISSTCSHFFFSTRKQILTKLIGINNFNRLKLFIKK